VLTAIAAILLSNAPTLAPTPVALVEPDPKKMTRSQIREHNKQLDPKHPFYIRCVRSAPIGSLVSTNFSCRTNRQWDAADRVGNQEARVIQEQMTSKFTNTN
jgi:hypothetical protein